MEQQTLPKINSIADIRKFLATEERPVTMEEFTEFWTSLTDAEKTEFRNTELT